MSPSRPNRPTSQVHSSKPTPRLTRSTNPVLHTRALQASGQTSAPRISVTAAILQLPRLPTSPRVTRRPARRLPPLAASALTDHLLQLIIVPVNGPGQGAGVLGHDGGSSFRSSLKLADLSRLLAARLPTPNRRRRAPTNSLGSESAGARGHLSGRLAGAHSTGGPRLLPLRVLHSPVQLTDRPHNSRNRSFAWAQPLRPALHPSPTHGPNFPFSLHLPTRSALTSPRRALPTSGPPSIAILSVAGCTAREQETREGGS
jgi:hypothetical protein